MLAAHVLPLQLHQASLDLRLRDDFYGFDMRAGGGDQWFPNGKWPFMVDLPSKNGDFP